MGKPKRYSGACGRFIRRIDKRDRMIRDKDSQIFDLNVKIGDLTNFKNRCINSNKRLITKNNALLDTTQFYNDQLFGYGDPSSQNNSQGYIQAVIDAKNQKDDILSQKIAQPASKSEGFDSMYNKLDGENTIIQNQIKINQEQHSIDNQNYTNLSQQIDMLNKFNEIFGWILFAVIVISATIIWFSNKSLTHRLVMVKVVWLYLILIEILEYVLFYAYIYVRAFLFGEQSTYKDYWKFPTLTWIDIIILILIALSVFI